jgi:hypothetical protein
MKTTSAGSNKQDADQDTIIEVHWYTVRFCEDSILPMFEKRKWR